VTQSPVFNFDESIDIFRRAIQHVNSRIINRAEAIDQIFCALLTREHALLQSRTGAAKSLLAQQVFSMFVGAHVFQVQASKEQQPDTYFGGLDIEQLKTGRLVHNTRDSLVESEFAFIDEIFDANDYTLRALLTTLNERALILGVQVVPARVHTVIAATNYLRVSEVTEAVLDRFIFKSLFVPSKTPAVQYKIARTYLEHGGRPSAPVEKIPYEILCRISMVITGRDPNFSMGVPSEVIFTANSVLRHYEMQRNRLLKERPHDHPQMKDFYISPRTMAKSIDMLRAAAFLHGRSDCAVDDVRKLWYMHTTVGLQDQKELFLKSCDTIINQLSAARAFEQIRKMLDFQDLLDHLRLHPEQLGRPLSSLGEFAVQRTLLEWAKEKLGLLDASVEHNRRVIEGYLKSFEPLTEEIMDLKRQQENDVHDLFNPTVHVWT